jgi:hypothetical protein
MSSLEKHIHAVHSFIDKRELPDLTPEYIEPQELLDLLLFPHISSVSGKLFVARPRYTLEILDLYPHETEYGIVLHMGDCLMTLIAAKLKTKTETSNGLLVREEDFTFHVNTPIDEN